MRNKANIQSHKFVVYHKKFNPAYILICLNLALLRDSQVAKPINFLGRVWNMSKRKSQIDNCFLCTCVVASSDLISFLQ